MKKILNVIERLGNLEEVGEGIWRSGFWFRPGKNFDIFRVFNEREGPSVKGGRIEKIESHGDRTIFSFRDDILEHGKAAPKRFGQNGCATTFEAATLSEEDKQRLHTAVAIFARRNLEVGKYMASHPLELEEWEDGIGGHVNIFSRDKINLRIWLDRSQFEGESLLYVAFDSSHCVNLENFVNKYFGSDFETIEGGYNGKDYEWDEASARLHLRNPIEESSAGRPRWENFIAQQGDEYYFGLNQFLEESDEDFIDGAAMLIGEPILIEWQKELSRNEMVKKAQEWDGHIRSIGTMGRQRFEFARNPYWVKIALADAGGQCQGCKQQAPFQTARRQPYLEVHHIKSLSHGGTDTLKNMAAICPNCHRRAHFGRDAEVLNKKLRQLAQKRSI